MKQAYRSLWVLLTLILLTGCLGDNNGEGNKPTPKIENITLRISMPDYVKFDNINMPFAYYWQEQDQLYLVLETQEGKPIISTQNLHPSRLTSDGKQAIFNVTLPEGHSAKEIKRVYGCITKGEKVVDNSLTIKGNIQAALSDINLRLPYNLRRDGFDIPLYIRPQNVTIEANNLIKLSLTSEGVFRLISIKNVSDKEVELKGNIGWQSTDLWTFGSDNTTFNFLKEKYTKDYTSNTLPLTAVPDKLAINESSYLLLWMPTPTKATHVDAFLGKNTSNISDNFFATSAGTHTATMYLEKWGNISVTGGIKEIVPADISNGGDALFSFDDIKYWVGTGAKRAAFILDFHDDRHPGSLVWGYRYDDVDKEGKEKKNAGQMIEEICNSDPRLFMVMSKAMGGYNSIFSYAYLLESQDKPFTIYYKDKALKKISEGVFGLDFDPKGDDNAVDHLTHNGKNILWQTGFYENGYWTYYEKSNRVMAWSYASSVPWGIDLTPDCWHAFSWTKGLFQGNSVLSNTFIAVEPPVK